jgi:Tfp pilus assembly protein PilZ
MAKDDAQERRDLRAHIRFRVPESPAVVYPEKFLNKLGLGRGNRAYEAVNLSEGGVLVSLTKPLDEGARVRVRVEVERFSDVFECAGEIRWCRPAAKTGLFYAGVKFIDLDGNARKRISHLRDVLNSKEYKTKHTGIRRRGELETPS